MLSRCTAVKVWCVVERLVKYDENPHLWRNFLRIIKKLLASSISQEEDMSDLTIREDDWSFKIVAAGSTRFYVTISTSRGDTRKIVFPDFILNQDDNERAIEALHMIKKQFYGPASGMKLIFRDIHPSFQDEDDRVELIRRHDQIVEVVKEYAAQTGLVFGNAMLEPIGGKFETLIWIE